MNFQPMITRLLETARRPGLLGLAGQVIERRCQRELAAYFRKLGSSIRSLHLESLAESDNAEVARHTAEMRLGNVLRTHQPLLRSILETNGRAAQVIAWMSDDFSEADAGKKPPPNFVATNAAMDRLGITGRQAAEYAAQYAAQSVAGIDATTSRIVADIIQRGILERLGVPGTARALREAIDGMTGGRARLIASTEMNDAMSQATLEKLFRNGAQYKQLIASPDACDECLAIAEAGPVPLGDSFEGDEDTYDRTPIHPGCRCATTGARPPEGDQQ